MPVAEAAEEPEEVSRPGAAVRNALFTVLFGLGLVFAAGLVSGAVTRRIPHLRTEIFRARFVATALLLAWSALTAVGALQKGGSFASMSVLATVVVVATGFGLWWVPRYLDGLWVVLAAHQRDLEIDCNGIRGALKEVGPLRATLVDSLGNSTSVPISSFGGAVVREVPSGRVQLALVVSGDVERARLRAVVSPFRDPSEPVQVERESGRLTVRCWDAAAAACLETQLLAL